MVKRGIWVILASMLIVACSKTGPTESISIATSLSDNGTMSMTFTIEFPDRDSHADFLENLQKIKYALTLMFSNYRSDELTNIGISNNTIKRLLSSRFNVNYDKVKIDDYDVRDKFNKKAKKQTVFTGQGK